ncbi:ABC transporter ATP-binding protein [Rhabdothermincola salaria]|uniref:ABC transporter ATP-binding protein n=1 Tax=Rhabdothermincola salaria TaxID=2903142 RepID=UPI001E3F05CF|nr:ABC transporter ATP-binding protein [Rhabdothermincola salaria]
MRPDRPATPAVEVLDLVVDHGSLRAVDHLTFRAHRGEVTALLGPNGAGKTTTVETLEGYRRPSGGVVRVLGCDPVAEHRAVVGRIGVMLQSGGVYTGIRVEEAVRLFAAYYAEPEDAEELLGRVGLRERRRATWKQLSGGEQQRLSLALALVGRPEVVFLDEPTAGIDPSGRQVIRQVVRDLRAEGVCVVLTTHDLDEAARLADQVVIIDHGRLLAEGTPHDLMNDDGGAQVRFGAPGGLDITSLSAHLDARVTEVTPGEYLVDAPPAPATVAALTAWLAEHDAPLADLRAGRQSLEDVFLRLTADAGRDREPDPDPDPPGRGARRRSRR